MSESPAHATHVVISGVPGERLQFLVPPIQPDFHQNLQIVWSFGSHHTCDSFNAASLAGV